MEELAVFGEKGDLGFEIGYLGIGGRDEALFDYEGGASEVGEEFGVAVFRSGFVSEEGIFF